MKLASFEAIVKVFDDAEVRYLVAGGLAVNAYGYLRYTKDVDFIVQLSPDNIIKAFRALKPLGYKPLVPVTAEQFADASLRESWIQEKGMKVLQFWSDEHKETPIDMFVTEPVDFDCEYEHALLKPLGKMTVRFVTIPALIKMKQAAGRPGDLLDIEFLKRQLNANE